MASQQNSTTQSIYSLGSEEPDITNMGLMTQYSSHTSNKHMRKLNLSEYIQLQMYPARLTSELSTYASVSTKGWWGLTAASQL